MGPTFFYFKKILFVFRERGREREREGEKHQCVGETSIGCLLHAPNRGPGPKTRHVLGIELATFGLQDEAQHTKPHQSGLEHTFLVTREIMRKKALII